MKGLMMSIGMDDLGPPVAFGLGRLRANTKMSTFRFCNSQPESITLAIRLGALHSIPLGPRQRPTVKLISDLKEVHHGLG